MQAPTGKIRAEEPPGESSALGKLLLALLLAAHRGAAFHPALGAGRGLLAGVGKIRLQRTLGPGLLRVAGRPDAARGTGLASAVFGGLVGLLAWHCCHLLALSLPRCALCYAIGKPGGACYNNTRKNVMPARRAGQGAKALCGGRKREDDPGSI